MFFSKAAGHKFVDRGDPTGFDFTIGNFVIDYTWQVLDLSPIVPAGAVFVMLRVSFEATTGYRIFKVDKNGNTNDFCAHIYRGGSENLEWHNTYIVACDKDRKIRYKATSQIDTKLNLTVAGWFV